MPDPRFVTNDIFGAPGVYVREIPPPAGIAGLRLNDVGIAGECVRGPVGRRIECDSYARFLAIFGGRDKGAGGPILGAIWKQLQGKRIGKLHVVRVAAAAAVAASFTLETAAGGGGTAVLRIDANGPGTWGNDVQFKVAAASNADANSFNLTIRYLGKDVVYENLNISGSNDNISLVVGSDDSNLVILTKLAAGRPVNNAASVDGADASGFVNLGETVAAFVSVAGTDGSIADTDYTGTGKAMEILNSARGVSICYVAGRSNAAIRTKVLALAPTANQRVWLVCPDSETVTYSTANTEAAALRHGRICYAWNHPIVIDPDTGTEMVQEPSGWVASILSQTDPEVHIGDVENAELTKGVVRVTWDVDETIRDACDAAGVTVFHKDLDEKGNSVFVFANGLTTDLDKNKRQLDGRRMKDFIISGLAFRMRGDTFKSNTEDRRERRKGDCAAWLADLALSGKYVATKGGVPQFSYENGDSVNPEADVGDGIQVDAARVKLIPKNLYLQLRIEIGTKVINFVEQ